MAVARFRFYEELNDFLPVAQRKREIELRFEPPAPVRHLIEGLGVPHTEIEIILVNGESVGLERQIEDGDRVSVYPVFEALDVTPLLRLRPHPLRELLFLADAHLGKLARHLRMLGFDTLFFNDLGDRELAELAGRQRRILLSRDRALLMRGTISPGSLIRSTDPREQLRQVVQRFDLGHSLKPFSRCVECNELLRTTDKTMVLKQLPPGVAERYDAFLQCSGCGKVFWKGSHYREMRRFIDDLVDQPRE